MAGKPRDLKAVRRVRKPWSRAEYLSERVPIRWTGQTVLRPLTLRKKAIYVSISRAQLRTAGLLRDLPVVLVWTGWGIWVTHSQPWGPEALEEQLKGLRCAQACTRRICANLGGCGVLIPLRWIRRYGLDQATGFEVRSHLSSIEITPQNWRPNGLQAAIAESDRPAIAHCAS